MVILAHFPLLVSTGSFTANGSCLGLTFDQCGDRAQTKQAQCLGAGGGGWGGREADHLPSTQALFGLPWRSGPPSSPSLFIAFALSPLSCRLSLCSAPHNCHPLLTWVGPPLSPLGTCVCAKPPTPHPGATATNSRTRLPGAGVFVLVHCSVYPHRLEWCQAHIRHSGNTSLGKDGQSHPAFQQQQTEGGTPKQVLEGLETGWEFLRTPDPPVWYLRQRT